MRLTGRSISAGKARGKVLKLNEAFSFLGGVDGATGELRVENGGNVKDRILVFPRGKGSTVGSFTMYDLKVHEKQPAAVINRSAETIVATGAVISSIPMVDRIDVDLLVDGDDVTVDGDDGTIEIHNARPVNCVSSVVFAKGKMLMLKRPDDASSYPGVWSLVAGRVEDGEDIANAAKREIYEETGIRVSSPHASLDPMLVREKDVIWKVFPFLFIHDNTDVTLNSENRGYEWIIPEEIEKKNTVASTIKAVRELLSKVKNQ
jgi:predicted aconitase with swiveling domain